ncbi:hypothetical protein C2869_09420 [Saccharobesus litoralis]|uniref:Uncharacterized protein n=1 Tax=Saccharobesus litoralis TaxID=2172099 RepID=A0A2S0VQZ3_9ALTE|nr:hypothetical protein [Saccharobesus litoralis]AWB66636.1 hypothetical protein C2869_09420 [Saccharobesus litoralis]
MTEIKEQVINAGLSLREQGQLVTPCNLAEQLSIDLQAAQQAFESWLAFAEQESNKEKLTESNQQRLMENLFAITNQLAQQQQKSLLDSELQIRTNLQQLQASTEENKQLSQRYVQVEKEHSRLQQIFKELEEKYAGAQQQLLDQELSLSKQAEQHKLLNKLDNQSIIIDEQKDKLNAQEQLIYELRKQVESLSVKEQKASEQVSHLQQTLTDVSHDLQQQTELTHGVEQTEQQLQRQVIDLTRLLEDKEKSLVASQSDLEALSKQLEHNAMVAMQSKQATDSEAERLTRELNESNSRLREEQTLAHQLKMQLEGVQEQAEVQQLKFEQRLANEQRDFADKQDRQNKEIANLIAENRELLQKQDQLAEQERQLKQQLKQATDKVAAMERLLERKTSDLEHNQNMFNEARENFKQTLEEVKQKNSLLSDTVVELESQQSATASEYRQQVDRLEKQLHSDSQVHQHELQSLHEQIASGERHVEQQQQALQVANGKVDELLQQLKQQETEHKQQNQAQDKKLQTIELNLRDTQEKVQWLEGVNARLEKARDTKQQQKQDEEEQVRETIRDLRNHIHTLEQQYIELEQNSQERLTEYRLKFEYAQRQLEQHP